MKSLVSANIHDAKIIQAALRDRVKITPLRKKPKFIAGVDAAFSEDKVIAVACLYQYPELIPVEDAFVVGEVSFPYITGYLSFREGPAIIAAVQKLSKKPDVILFDGQGIAHPKHIGIASHIGVLTNVPTIGCAKTRLIGEYQEPKLSKGSWSPLLFQSNIVGAVLRTKDNIKPLFVSPGHLIDLESSLEIVLRCLTQYRIPEPLRRADHISKIQKRLSAG